MLPIIEYYANIAVSLIVVFLIVAILLGAAGMDSEKEH